MPRYASTWPYHEVTRADYEGCGWSPRTADRHARQYAADTVRLADAPTPTPGPRPARRPGGPQWGDDIPMPDDVHAQLVAYETYAPNIRAAQENQP